MTIANAPKIDDALPLIVQPQKVWEPNIRLNEKGEIGLSFYTADCPSTYTIVIEGITDDGKVCRYVKQIK